MADPTPLMTVAHADGTTEQVKDTPGNRQLAAQNGLEIKQGLLADAWDFMVGANEGSIVGRATQGIVDKIAGIDREADMQKRLPDHSGTLTVVHEDGTREAIKDTEGNRQLASDNGLKIESANETRAHDIAALPEYSGARGAGNVFAGKMQSEFLMGLPEMARKADLTPENRVAYDEIQKQHDDAATGGAAAGFLGSMLLPVGEIGAAAKAEAAAGRALAKIGIGAESLGGKVVAGAAKHAVTGAAYSAPHAAGQLVFDSPEHAGESIAAGIGIGAVMGGLGPLAGKFFSTVMPAAASKSAEALESVAEHRTMKMLGLERGTLKKLGGTEEVESIGRTLLDAGIIKPGSTREQILEAAEKLGEDSGERIGKVLTSLDERVAADTAARQATKVENALSGSIDWSAQAETGLAKHGFQPGNVLRGIQDEIVAGKVGPFYEKEMRMARDAMKQIIATTTGAEVKVKGTLEDQIAQLVTHAESAPPTSFATGQKLKSLFQPDFGKNPLTLTEKDVIERKLYGIVTGELNNAAERVAEASGDKALMAEYSLAKQQYRAVRQTDQIRQNLVAKNDGNRFFTPSDGLVGHAGTLLGMGHAAEHGGSALAGGVGGMLASYAVKRIAESTPFQTALIGAADKGAKVMRALAAEHVATKIAELDNAIARLAVRGEQAAMSNRTPQEHDVSPISAIMGGSEKDSRKALEAFQDKMTDLMKDPERLNGRLSSLANTVAQSGDPDAAMGLMQTQMNAIQYLQETMPKSKMSPGMFVNAEYRPTLNEIKMFEERCAAAADPFYLTRKIEDGTLNGVHLETVKRIYPQITDVIAKRIESMGYENALSAKPVTLPYDARSRLARLNAAVADPTMSPQLAAMLQGNFKTNQAQPQTQPHSSKPMKSISNVATSVQRIASKRG